MSKLIHGSWSLSLKKTPSSSLFTVTTSNVKYNKKSFHSQDDPLNTSVSSQQSTPSLKRKEQKTLTLIQEDIKNKSNKNDTNIIKILQDFGWVQQEYASGSNIDEKTKSWLDRAGWCWLAPWATEKHAEDVFTAVLGRDYFFDLNDVKTYIDQYGLGEFNSKNILKVKYDLTSPSWSIGKRIYDIVQRDCNAYVFFQC